MTFIIPVTEYWLEWEIAQWLKHGGRKEVFYLTTHSTHFIYGYMESDIWLRTILIVRKETRCCHMSYSFWLTARVLLYAPSHRQDSTYHIVCYTSRGALAGTRNSSMGPPHEGSIWWPIAPWANALTTELHLAPSNMEDWSDKPLHHRWWVDTTVNTQTYFIGVERLLNVSESLILMNLKVKPNPDHKW